MSDQVLSPTPTDQVAPVSNGSGRSRGPLIIGPLLLVLGLALALAATFVLQGQGWSQALAYTLAFIMLYSGLGKTGKGIWGSDFDFTFWFSATWIALITLSALIAPLLPLKEHKDSALTLMEPTLARPDLLSANILGTNNLGLDIFARLIYGARVSLVVALIAVSIGIVVGGAFGILAGFYRRITDRAVAIFTNALLAVPPLILLIALATVLKPNIMNLSFALSLMALPSMVRIARANTLTFAQREFVLAGRSMGASNLRLMVRELLPNVLLPMLSYAMVLVSVLIVAEASLSFLGLGTPPPAPTWGNMIAEGEGRMFQTNPHLVIVPGLVLFLTVFSFNYVGEKARSQFDSRQVKV